MAFKMKGNPMQRNFGLSSIASKNKAGAMGVTGALGFGKNPMRKNEDEYKVPSPAEQARLTQEYRDRTGRDETYDPRLSKIDGAHRFS